MRLRMHIRRVLGPVAALVLSVSLMGATTVAGPDGQPPHLPDQRPAVPAVPSIPHTVATPHTRPAPHDPVATTPKAVTWPAAGDADVVATQAAAATGVRAGGLPIVVGTHASAHVHVADQATGHRAGVTGVLFTVTPSAPGTMSVGVDYTAFQDAGGAEWGSRLRLVSLPACALTTPTVHACQVQTPIPSTNNASTHVVTANVTPANGVVLAAVAGLAGTNGTFQASSLKPSGTWSAAGASGAFTWQYPISVPPASAGSVAPSIALSYDSQTVDGETAGTNTQPSWVGEGWDYSPGYIERTYRTCADDTTLPTAEQTLDQCWAGQVVSMNLNGQTASLVADAGGVWHASSDNGDRGQLLTGAGNGALNGEYWEITTTAGIHYFFGRDGGPGAGATNSTWTVPVYGAHPGDPCYDSAGFASSRCVQAWRWNLDYVEDPHGNVTMYYYTPETNYYGANNGTTGVSYVRGGYLNRIDYGLRDENDTVYGRPAPDQVQFTVAERCDPSGSVTCDPSQLSTANAKNWPDTPADQLCTATQVCNNHGPTFWSTKQLTTIATQYYDCSGYTKVDSYALGQSFSAAGDPALVLNSITRTGYAADGTSIAVPAITFAYQMMDNRVAGYNNEPPMSRYRLTSIENETGERILVTYGTPQCTATNVPATPSQDTMLCYPVYWMLPYQTTQTLDYFHKYVTDEVDVQDPDALSPTQQTTYTYDGDPAWHYDDNEVVKPADRSYGQWRGYGEVDVRTGDTSHAYDGVADQQTLTETTYFRGMNGDTLPNGATRSVSVSDSLKESVADDDQYADTPYEVRVFDGDGGAEVSTTITNPVTVATTASRARTGLPDLLARLVRTGTTRVRTDLAAGGARTTTTVYSYDSAGRQVQQTESGDGVPDVCTTTGYADNTTTWVRDKIAETVVSQQACPVLGAAPAPVLSDTRTYYDGSATLGAVTAGAVTREDAATANANGTLTWATTSTATFDAEGRSLSTTDANGNATSIAYTPADGGNLTGTVTTNPVGQTSSVTIDPGRGIVTATVDVAGHRTDTTHDALGRLAAEWLPDHDKSAGAAASVTYAYLLRADGPESVTTNTLVDTGTGTDYVTSIKLYDALGQLLQTQTAAEGGGRQVSDTFYDSHGWVSHTNNRYDTDGAPSTTLITVADGEVASRTVTTHDGTGRAVLATDYDGLTATDSTQTVYGGDRTTVLPPRGGVTSTTLTDARGHTVETRQYTAAPTVSGGVVTGGTYDSTFYTYTPQGQQGTVTDADGNVWTYGYDLLGHQTSATDPDTGRSTYSYDLAGNLTSSTDARGQTVAYTYDPLNRRTAEYSGSTNGTMLASWTYDTVQAGKPTSSTRYTPQGQFMVGYGNYDGAGNPTSYSVLVPSSVPGVGGTYTTHYAYTTTNQVSDMQPAPGGGLPGETIANGYDSFGNEDSSDGYSVYLGGASYTPFGEPAQYTLGALNATAWLTYDHDAQTRRVTDVNLSAQIPTPQLDDTRYTYDPSGNVIRGTDLQGPAGSPTQTQCDGYDGLDRLVQAWTATDNCATAPTTATIGGTNPFWESWSIDPAGLRTSQIRHAAGGDTTTTYTYPAGGSGQAHTLTSTTTTGPNGTSTTGYGYDAAGNTTGIGNQKLAWDAENHLAADTTANGTTSHVYDADGTELLVTGPNSTTLHLPGEDLTYDATTKTVTGTRYYTANGLLVAERVGGADPVYLDGPLAGTAVSTPDAGPSTATQGTPSTVTGPVPGADENAAKVRNPAATSVLPADEATSDPSPDTGPHAPQAEIRVPAAKPATPHDNAQPTMEIAYNPDNESVTRRQFDPYGNPIGAVTATSPSGGSGPGVWPDRRGFLDDPSDSATGLTTIGARQYDASIGRFVSADPLLDPADPQSLSGYAYAGDNPVTDSDPSGLWSWGGFFKAVANVANVVSIVAGVIPLCAVCQTVSLAAGLVSAAGYAAAGDGTDATLELTGTVISVAMEGFGSVSRVNNFLEAREISNGLDAVGAAEKGAKGVAVRATAWAGGTAATMGPEGGWAALKAGAGHMPLNGPAPTPPGIGHYVRFEIHTGLLAM